VDNKRNTSGSGGQGIIDRTLPEVVLPGSGINGSDLLDLIGRIRALGVDKIEINRLVLEKAGGLPEDGVFIYRVDSISALEDLSLHPFKDIVINNDTPSFGRILEEIALRGRNITIEVRAETEEDLHCLKKLREAGWMKAVGTLRITGLNRFITTAWLKTALEMKCILGVKLDICPENLFYNATAVAADGLMDSADHITASFMGYGGRYGYAALEQILTFAAVTLGRAGRGQLEVLPGLAALFSKAAGVEIPGNAPVIGKNIFVYESGIHADGIDKDPATYEPYDPGLVGLERKLSIGKHSGGRSVAKKLQELGIPAERSQISDFLKRIRERSILLRRSLEDHEIVDLSDRSAVSDR
jgi:homocitrate synthase NifV